MIDLSYLNLKTGRIYAWIGTRTVVPALLLVILGALFWLPGIYGLPPVDRTEVVYAQMARQMIESWNFTEARFQQSIVLDRPFGTLWIQSLFAWLSGTADEISSYRLASATFTIAALCILFWLSRDLYGGTASLLGALWLAGAPLIILQGHLALSKPLLLPFLIAAQMCLAHAYIGLKLNHNLIASLFWLAQAAAVVIGGLAIASVSLVTIIALTIWDRTAERFKPIVLHPSAIVWLIVATAWFYNHAVYFAEHASTNLDFRSSIGALIEPQHMHLSAPPGAFILLLLVGVLPMLVLVFAVIDVIRHQPEDRKIKFLLAWIIPYIIVLELFSSKPPTYMVQSVIPAIALLAGLALVRIDAGRGSSQTASRNWWLSSWFLILMIQPFALLGLAWFSGLQFTLLSVAMVFATSFLFAGAIAALRGNLVFVFAVLSSMAGLTIYPLLLSQVLPSYRSYWVSPQLKDALDKLQTCTTSSPGGPVTVLSYTEPSVVFLLGTATDLTPSADIAERALMDDRRLVVADSRHSAPLQKRLAARGQPLHPIACVSGTNYARAENVTLEIYLPDEYDRNACKIPKSYICASRQQ